MEKRRERLGAPAGRDAYQSFSSSLLDAIYRSIDESDSGGAAPPHRTRGAPDSTYYYQTYSSATTRKKSPSGYRTAAVTRPPRAARFRDSTSSSSDASSYGGGGAGGGFSSSSEAEQPKRARASRLRPIRTGCVPTRSDRCRFDPAPAASDKNTNSTKGGRLKDLRHAKPPASPGARLASFVNALFGAAGTPRRDKVAAEERGPPAMMRRSATAQAQAVDVRGRRTIKSHGVDRAARAAPPPAIPRKTTAVAERRRAEVVRRDAVKEDEDDVASDDSSDLFELENLTAIGRYRDELPVYGSTHLDANLGIGHPLIL